MKELRKASLFMLCGGAAAPIITATIMNQIYWTQFIIPGIAILLIVISFVKK